MYHILRKCVYELFIGVKEINLTNSIFPMSQTLAKSFHENFQFNTFSLILNSGNSAQNSIEKDKKTRMREEGKRKKMAKLKSQKRKDELRREDDEYR